MGRLCPATKHNSTETLSALRRVHHAQAVSAHVLSGHASLSPAWAALRDPVREACLALVRALHATLSARDDQRFRRSSATSPKAPPCPTKASPDVAPESERVLERESKEESVTAFPSAGSAKTLPHSGTDFEFKMYAGPLFDRLRRLWGIDTLSFVNALCGPLYEVVLLNAKPLQFMFFAKYKRFVVKTVSKLQADCLLRILPKYTSHITLVTPQFRITP